MKQINLLLSLFLVTIISENFAQPIALHDQNPHYLSYQGQPILLITSAEHYGAVLNQDFDYQTYLQTLHDEGMNYTRIFSGAYVEVPGNFGIENNTLAPAPGSYITPWKRVDESGLFKNEGKFDLEQWNPDYFDRLINFMHLAAELDIIVEYTFFCSTYQDTQWQRNPFNAGNNVNNTSDTNRKKINTLANGKVTGYQKALIRKVIEELKDFDNLFYEIQNEPWSDDPQEAMRTLKTLDPKDLTWAKWSHTASPASLEWQQEMVMTITEAEASLSQPHLIAQNYTNFKHSLEEVKPEVDIINFHYAWPEAVWMNYAWDRPISFDESGFAGTADTTYLRQAWQFMLAGGAIFNNLDYSFFVGAEDGSGNNKAPGGGSTLLRQQLTYLKDFLESFEYVAMKPDRQLVNHAPGLEWQALVETGKQYAIFFSGVATDWVKLNLPRGSFRYEFYNPYNGKTVQSGTISSDGKLTKVDLPEFEYMIAVRILGL